MQRNRHKLQAEIQQPLELHLMPSRLWILRQLDFPSQHLIGKIGLLMLLPWDKLCAPEFCAHRPNRQGRGGERRVGVLYDI